MFSIIVLWVYDIFENNKLKTENITIFGKDLSNIKLLKNEVFLVIITILLIFLSYLPFFLRYYPGIVTSDSYSQIEQTKGSSSYYTHGNNRNIRKFRIKIIWEHKYRNSFI